MSHPPHPPRFNYPNNIRRRIQAVKFIIMQFSPGCSIQISAKLPAVMSGFCNLP
jgi:hypothetical protein